MCRLLGVTKQAYYKHVDSDMVKIAQEAFVVEFIKDIRKKDPGIGGNKLWIMYQKQFGASRSVGYNRFYDIVEKYNLKVRKVKRWVKTTDSTHDLPLYPNIVKDLLPIRLTFPDFSRHFFTLPFTIYVVTFLYYKTGKIDYIAFCRRENALKIIKETH